MLRRRHRLAVEEALHLVAAVARAGSRSCASVSTPSATTLQLEAVAERDDRLREHAVVCLGAVPMSRTNERSIFSVSTGRRLRYDRLE